MIIDFDRLYFDYARTWLKAHPGLTEAQIDDAYNDIMAEWIEQPLAELDGATPGTYFERFDACELAKLLREYLAADINVPEPLYSRIVFLGSEVAPVLRDMLADENETEKARAEALSLLRDMEDAEAVSQLEALVLNAKIQGELPEMAADVLSSGQPAAAKRLIAAYPTASEYAGQLILDIACNYPGDPEVTKLMLEALRSQPDSIAANASRLGKYGDEQAIPELKKCLNLTELNYLDYIELCDAIEALGGDADRSRSFFGDPYFEALRML